MQTSTTHSVPPIKSWHGYLDFIERNDEISKEITKMYADGCPPPGSLAWPGDLQLLEKYGVTCTEIFMKLSEIINETNVKLLDQIELAKKSEGKSRLDLTCNLSEKFTVKATYNLDENVDKIQCAYCKQMQLRNAGFEIINNDLEKSFYMRIPLLHIIGEHSDLGDPGLFGIGAKIVCKVLELGNTKLDKKDLLYKVAKAGKKSLEELEDFKLPDPFKREVMGSLMMSKASGRK